MTSIHLETVYINASQAHDFIETLYTINVMIRAGHIQLTMKRNHSFDDLVRRLSIAQDLVACGRQEAAGVTFMITR